MDYTKLGDVIASQERIIDDQVFKEASGYKAIAAILMNTFIDEYNDMDCKDVARLILDRTTRTNTDIDNILSSKIDTISRDINEYSKEIKLDQAFEAKSTKEHTLNLKNIVTINFEMQRSNPSEYNIISRAVLYAASLLKMSLKNSGQYSDLHKVYSVWLCDFIFKENELKHYDEIKNEAIHRYRMCRHYEDISKSSYDEAADLMEVVIVELPKLKFKQDLKQSTVYKMLFRSNGSFKSINDTFQINLTKYKEVKQVFDVNELLEKRLKEGEETGIELGENRLIKNMIKNQLKTGNAKDKIIKTVSINLGVEEARVTKLYEELTMN